MDRTRPFVRTLFLITSGSEPAVRAIVEQMRMFGYIQEPEYSEMNTIVSRESPLNTQRTDGAETIEMARSPGSAYMKHAGEREPGDSEEILPSEH